MYQHLMDQLLLRILEILVIKDDESTVHKCFMWEK